MNTFYFAFLKLKQKLHLNIIVVVEILIAMVLLNYVFGLFMNCYEPIKLLSKIDATGKQVCFYTNTDIDVYTEINKILKNFGKQKQKKDVASTYYADSIRIIYDELTDDQKNKLINYYNNKFGDTQSAENAFGVFTSGVVYDELVAKSLPIDLSKGKQLYEANTDPNTVPVILRNDFKDMFKVGDEFIVNVYVRKQIDEVSAELGKSIQIKAKVCGFLTSKHLLHDFTAATEGASAQSFLRNNDFHDIVILRTDSNPLADLDVNNLSFFKPVCNLINVADNTPEELQAIKNGLSGMLIFSDFQKLVSNSLEYFKGYATEPFAILVIFFIIALISICTVNTFIHMAQKKDFAVYYTCGAKWYNCLLIDFVRAIALIVPPSIVSCFVAYILFNKYEYITIDIVSSIWLVLIVDLIIYLITSLSFNIRLIRTKPIKYIREME